jgi:tetratricopeptide (TPR) repeat protein
MSSHNEQVKPSTFEVAAPTPGQASASPVAVQAERPTWVVPALLGLGLVALLVVFVLPAMVGPADIEPARIEPAAAVEAPTSSDRSTPQAPEASPWSDAQLAKLRKEAQDVLADLLEVQDLLEQTGVQLWAAEAFEQAKVFATEGDQQYRERKFQEAIENYKLGLAGMQAILESTDDALNGQLELARQSIEEGDRAAAQEALVIAQAIEPGSEELSKLRTRLAALDQLLPLLEAAATAEEGGDLKAAQEALKQAAAIDPLHQATASELARVSAAYTAMRFNDAMSDGYLALDESNFSAARSAFKRAATLSPGSSEAASALQEVQVAETADRLSRLARKGQAAEKKEQWATAVSAYQEALGIDANILYAQEGLQRSSVRAKLDAQFSSAISQPERLSDKTVAEATATLVRHAGTISPRGPVLEGQIQKLEVLLKQANTPLTLTLRSDGATDVIVYKVARLGQFDQHQLSLRPGEYTAVGTRTGYRDVRVNFSLVHNSPPPTVLISCTEQI